MSQTTARKGNYAEPPTNTTRPAGPSASDEFERFFAEQFRVLTPQPPVAVAPPAAPVKVEPNFDDPLMAELARIVGHGSPVLPKRQSAASAVEPAVQPYADTHFGEPRLVDASMGYWNDHSAPTSTPAPVEAVAKPVDPLDAFEAELRRFDEMHRASLRTDQPKTVLDLAQHAEPAAAPAVADPLQSIEDELRRYEAEAPESRGAAADPAYGDPVANAENIVPFNRARSRKIVLMLGTAATVALVGVIGAVSMKTAKRPGNGDAPVISASTLPIKEKPADPGGVEIPGQDRQVLAKGAVEAPKAANVVNREEQPVDLNQTPKRDVARVILPAPVGGAATGQAAQRPAAPIIMPPNNGSAQPAAPTTAGGFEAKRVRSVKVGPEGNAVAPPVAAVPAVPVAAPVVEAPPPVAAAPVAPKVATPATPPKAETKTASAPKSDARPTTAARTQTTTPQPQRQAARTAPAPAAADDDEDDVAGNKPLSLRPPAGASATRPVARTTSAPATTASTGGGFAVQLAAAGSEAEARSTAASMKQRHSALSSYAPSWRSSEVNGRTVYRVRVGGLSREKANELCGQIKSGGGSCFVASN